LSKISVSRLLDMTKLVESMTKAGIQGAEDLTSFLGEFTDQVIRGFKNGISLVDNIYGTEVTVSLKNNVSQKVKNDPTKTPKHIWISKVTPFENAALSFNWKLDSEQQIVVLATFTGSPTSSVTVNLVILY